MRSSCRASPIHQNNTVAQFQQWSILHLQYVYIHVLHAYHAVRSNQRFHVHIYKTGNCFPYVRDHTKHSDRPTILSYHTRVQCGQSVVCVTCHSVYRTMEADHASANILTGSKCRTNFPRILLYALHSSHRKESIYSIKSFPEGNAFAKSSLPFSRANKGLYEMRKSMRKGARREWAVFASMAAV